MHLKNSVAMLSLLTKLPQRSPENKSEISLSSHITLHKLQVLLSLKAEPTVNLLSNAQNYFLLNISIKHKPPISPQHL